MKKRFVVSRFWRSKAGFTLIELLVVVLIIAVLASIALPQYTKAVEKARAREGLMMTMAIAKANDLYYLTNGVYADSLDDLDIGFAGEDKPEKYVTSKAMRYFNCRPRADVKGGNNTRALCRRRGTDFGAYYFKCRDNKKGNRCFCAWQGNQTGKKWCEIITGKTAGAEETVIYLD